MTDDPEARAIAERLTKAQRAVLESGSIAAKTATQLRRLGLLDGARMTSLGLRVRARLAMMEARDGE